MEEQYPNEASGVPTKNKQGLLKMVLINVIVSAVVALIVSYIVVMVIAGPLAGQVQVLQVQMAKQMKAYKTN